MQTTTNTRRESRNIAGRFRGGKLVPIMAVPFQGGEGGVLSQTITMELDPIAGRLITPATAELTSVYVPVQAIDAIKAPDAPYAGLTEVIRQKLLTGAPLFAMEDEGELTKRMGIIPMSVTGVMRLCEVSRLAHNAAINFLRKRLYTYAAEIPHTNTGVTPALLSSTIIQRLNGALDPDPHINGAVKLSLPTLNLPVLGLGLKAGGTAATSQTVTESNGGSVTYARSVAGNAEHIYAKINDSAGTTPQAPQIFARLNAVAAGDVNLGDFYTAERMDQFTRVMREIADQNPQDGEDLVLRWVHGMSVDELRHPFVLFEQTKLFGQAFQQATDGVGLMGEVSLSRLASQISYTVPVPKTELGGIVITFAVLKPDETIASQPHPILSAPWSVINHVEEQLQQDPVPVTMRYVTAEVLQANEQTVAFYTGHNELKKHYVNYGFNRQVDMDTVDAKTAVWQLDIPASVTPENILYPADLDHYPFLDQEAEVCTYTIVSEAIIKTPTYFGPSPVETLDVIEDAEIFGDN